MNEWEKKGCFDCCRLWEKGQTPPLLFESIELHTKLYKCSICGTFWEEYERYADVVTGNEAKDRYRKVLSTKA